MKTVRRYLPAAIILIGVLVAWEVLVGASGVQGFVLPRPSAIWAAHEALDRKSTRLNSSHRL